MGQEYATAFEAWISSEAASIKRATSREIYRAIWGAFERDLPAGTSVLGITSEMVASYLAADASKLHAGENMESSETPKEKGDGLSIRYQARVASLIEKIMAHHFPTGRSASKYATSPFSAYRRGPTHGPNLLVTGCGHQKCPTSSFAG
jgi:hypothetical protein